MISSTCSTGDDAKAERFGGSYFKWRLVYLLLITCVPFTTVVVGRFAELAPAIWLYAGNTVLLGLVSFALIGALFQGVVSSGGGPAAHTQGHYITTVIASACRTALLSLALLWPHLGGGSRSSWGQETSMSYTRSEFPADLLAGEPSVERPARRKRGSFIRVLITFCAGVAATLAWQSYGDAAREIIANSYPQFSWLAPQSAAAEAVPSTVGAAAPSLYQQDLKAMSLGLAAVRQKIDQLAASQQQMTRDFTTKLQAVEQDILDKISVQPPQPAAAARKPVSPPLQVAPVR